MCDILEKELEFKERIVAENESFAAYIPFFCDTRTRRNRTEAACGLDHGLR